MDGIQVSVSAGGYPAFITLSVQGESIRITHKDLLALEHAVVEAKRQVLCNLQRKDWHEVDPSLAGK